MGCSPRGRDELDMTERLHFHLQSLCKSPYVTRLIFNLMSLQPTPSCCFPARLASLLPLGAFTQAPASLSGLQQCPLPGRLI